jgi:hypothetical protein
MSSLLENAIIDAATLKEVAMKNAEQMIIEKFSKSMKEAIENMLEQDGLEDEGDLEDLGNLDVGGEEGKSEVASEVPLAAVEGEKLCLCDCPDEEEEIEIDFGQLAKEMEENPENEMEPTETPEEFTDELSDEDKQTLTERDNKPTVKIPNQTMKDMVYGKKEKKEEVKEHCMEQPKEEELEDESLDEELDVNEEEIKELAEEMKVDVEVNPSGWLAANKTEDDMNKEFAAAKANDTCPSEEDKREEKEEEIKDLKKENKKFQKRLSLTENKMKEMEKLNEQLKSHLSSFSEKLMKVSLINAKLFYENKTLKSSSLNERQKLSIVEAISKTSSVEEAKAIFETLQNTVGSKKEINNSLPNSLREAIARKQSLVALRPRQSEDNLSNDPNTARWRKLAGINNK